VLVGIGLAGMLLARRRKEARLQPVRVSLAEGWLISSTS
jgi:hypothetical protein